VNPKASHCGSSENLTLGNSMAFSRSREIETFSSQIFRRRCRIEFWLLYPLLRHSGSRYRA
jgi:hypothetical protein